MIPDYECNKVYFSALLPKTAPQSFTGLTEVLDRYDVPYELLEGTNDIWCRDYMPVQAGHHEFAYYKYNPDYLQETKKYRASITDGREIARKLRFRPSGRIGDIRIDGGNVVRCDGKVIMTAKVFEENPGITARQLTDMLENAFAAEIIFVPWDPAEFFGHADGICRYLGDDRVLLTNYREIDPAMARRFVNCLKPHFAEVHELAYDVRPAYKDNWAYINWLQTDKVLILPSFGVPEDNRALQQIEALMPTYCGRIEQVDARDLIVHQGCFNCASWTILDVPDYSVY